MNPLLAMQILAPMLERLLASGKLDGLIPDKGLAPLKEIFSGTATAPEQQVLSALSVLAEHAPFDPAQAEAYTDAITMVVTGISRLKAMVKGDSR